MSLPVHWIQSVTDQGKRVVLEDGSVWQICPHCASTVTRWSLNYHVEIADRGTTYKYSYSLLASLDGDVGAPVHAICVKAAKVRQQTTVTYD